MKRIRAPSSAILQSMLDEFEAKRARLIAERDDLAEMTIPAGLTCENRPTSTSPT